jgi:hypothetical protein
MVALNHALSADLRIEKIGTGLGLEYDESVIPRHCTITRKRHIDKIYGNGHDHGIDTVTVLELLCSMFFVLT